MATKSATKSTKSESKPLFETILGRSGKGLLKSRAKILADSTELEMDSFVKNIEKKLNTVKLNLSNLEDLSSDSTTSTKQKDFEPEEWIAKLQELSLEKANLEIELEIAKENQVKYFG